MKTPSAFECAIRAAQQENSALPERILAIDMDACAAALCARDEGGFRFVRGVRLDAAEQSPASLYESALAHIPGGSALKEADIARAWKKYVRSGRKDEAGGVPCAGLEAAFDPAAQLYKELFALADDLLGDDAETGILLFGSMAARSLAQHVARSHFSVDPFLPDPLFIAAAQPESLEARGRALIETESRRTFEGPAALMLMDRKGERTPMPLSDDFSGGFFACAGDRLDLRLGDRQMTVTVPESLFAPDDCGMLTANIERNGSAAAIHLRTALGNSARVELTGA